MYFKKCISAGIFRAWEFHYWYSFTRKKNKIWSVFNRARAHVAIDLRIDISIWYSMPETMRGSRKKKKNKTKKEYMCLFQYSIIWSEKETELVWDKGFLSASFRDKKREKIGKRRVKAKDLLDGKKQSRYRGFFSKLELNIIAQPLLPQEENFNQAPKRLVGSFEMFAPILMRKPSWNKIG